MPLDVGKVLALPEAERLPALERLIDRLGPDDREELVARVRKLRRTFSWKPLPGGQELLRHLVRNSDVQIIGNLGEAGPGKTHSFLCIAAEEFENPVYYRRNFVALSQADGAIDRTVETLKWGRYGKDKASGGSRTWKLSIRGKKRTVSLSAIPDEKALRRVRGKGRDGLFFDEAAEFPELYVRMAVGWQRTRSGRGRTCLIIGSNPPASAEGYWLLAWFGPWIDNEHELYPTAAGVIRWAVFRGLGEAPLWVDGPGPHTVDGAQRWATSITWVPAFRSENPIYADGKYERTLDMLPEPYRSQLARGDFKIGLRADIRQVIPAEWIRAAQKRWRENPLSALPRDARRAALGVPDQHGADIAHGGADSTTVASRWGDRVELDADDVQPGKVTPDGPAAALFLLERMVAGGVALVDANGVGASAYEFAKQGNEARVYPFIGSQAPNANEKDRSGLLGFNIMRALLYWNGRELLDPANGRKIELPPHPQIVGDLSSAKHELRTGKITLDAKDDQKKILGHSPDVGEAVLLSLLDVSRLPRELAAQWGDYFDGKVRAAHEREAAEKKAEEDRRKA